MATVRRQTAARSNLRKSARVWVVDDHCDVRDSLATLLRAESYTVRCFTDAEALFADLTRSQPECLILDYALPGSNGLETQARLHECDVCVPVIFLTGRANLSLAVEVMRRGALDLIEKPCSSERLLEAVAAAVNVRRAEYLRQHAVARYTAAAHRLSPREREVLAGIVQGLRNKHIAAALKISPRTVESHREAAMRKLSVHSTAEMVSISLLTGLSRDISLGP